MFGFAAAVSGSGFLKGFFHFIHGQPFRWRCLEPVSEHFVEEFFVSIAEIESDNFTAGFGRVMVKEGADKSGPGIAFNGIGVECFPIPVDCKLLSFGVGQDNPLQRFGSLDQDAESE